MAKRKSPTFTGRLFDAFKDFERKSSQIPSIKPKKRKKKK